MYLITRHKSSVHGSAIYVKDKSAVVRSEGLSNHGIEILYIEIMTYRHENDICLPASTLHQTLANGLMYTVHPQSAKLLVAIGVFIRTVHQAKACHLSLVQNQPLQVPDGKGCNLGLVFVSSRHAENSQ